MKTNRYFILGKRALSMLLTFIIVMGSVTIGLTDVAIKVNAAALPSKLPSEITGASELKFVVPECIYLYPNATSWKDSTYTPFQYYVNNNSDGTVKSGYDTEGYIYYSYKDGVNATLTYKYYNADLSAELNDNNASINLDQTTVSNGGKITITGGTSPSLAKNVSGYYIFWTLSYGENKACAYTYVYKPYTVPLGNGVDLKHYKDIWTGSVLWASGFHSISGGTRANVDYKEADTGTKETKVNLLGYGKFKSEDHSFASWISKSQTVYYNGSNGSLTTHTAKTVAPTIDVGTIKYASGAENRYIAFANNTKASGLPYFNVSVDNTGAHSWGSDTLSGNTYDVANFRGFKYDTTKDTVIVNIECESKANITIDTSRYTNLSQIPNLNVGFMVTDDENCTNETASWYVASYSGKQGSGNFTYAYDSIGDDWNSTFKDYNSLIAGQIATNDGVEGRAYSNTNEGVRYAGTWVDEIDESYSQYGVKGVYINRRYKTNSKECTGMDSEIIYMNATQYNKATLRAAVAKATKAMSKLGVTGVSNGVLTSKYFNDSVSTKYNWNTFSNLYFAATRGLTKLDGSFSQTANGTTYTDPASLATALESAMNNLGTAVNFNANGGTVVNKDSNQTNLEDIFVTVGLGNGTYSWSNKDATYRQAIRPGYEFAGWTADSSYADANNSVNENFTDPKTATVGYNNTLYAVWKRAPITLKLDAKNGDSYQGKFPNGGTSKEITGLQKYDSDMIALDSSYIPTLDGYNCIGFWNAKGEGGDQYYSVDISNNTISPYRDKNGKVRKVYGSGYTSSITLYAHYSAKSFGISFDKAGGIDGIGTDFKTVSFNSQQFEDKTNVVIPQRSGFDFKGYYTEPNGNGDNIVNANGGLVRKWEIDVTREIAKGSSDYSFTDDGKIILYAYWQVRYETLNINTDGGTTTTNLLYLPQGQLKNGVDYGANPKDYYRVGESELDGNYLSDTAVRQPNGTMVEKPCKNNKGDTMAYTVTYQDDDTIQINGTVKDPNGSTTTPLTEEITGDFAQAYLVKGKRYRLTAVSTNKYAEFYFHNDAKNDAKTRYFKISNYDKVADKQYSYSMDFTFEGTCEGYEEVETGLYYLSFDQNEGASGSFIISNIRLEMLDATDNTDKAVSQYFNTTRTIFDPVKTGYNFVGWTKKVNTTEEQIKKDSTKNNIVYTFGAGGEGGEVGNFLTARWEPKDYIMYFAPNKLGDSDDDQEKYYTDRGINLLYFKSFSYKDPNSDFTCDYDEKTGIFTVNGTPSSSQTIATTYFPELSHSEYSNYYVMRYEKISETDENGIAYDEYAAGDGYKFPNSAPTLHMDLSTDGKGLDSRKYCDIKFTDSRKRILTGTKTFNIGRSEKVNSVVLNYYTDGNSNKKFYNLKFRVKLESVPNYTSSATDYSPNPITVTYDNELGTLPTAERNNYSFGGWKTLTQYNIKTVGSDNYIIADSANYNVVPINSGNYYQVDDNITVYARWNSIQAKFLANKPSNATGKVELNLNSGVNSNWQEINDSNIPTISLDKSTSRETKKFYCYNDNKVPLARLTGWTFKGWYYNGSDYNNSYGKYSTKYDEQTNAGTNQQDVALAARWEANTYTVSFNTNPPQKDDGTYETVTNSDEITTQLTVTYDSFSSNIVAPVIPGYIFKGYYDGAGETAKQYYNENGESCRIWDKTEGATLVAHWAPAVYTITFVTDATYDGKTVGGQNDFTDTLQISYNADLPEIVLPQYSGLTFLGYFTVSHDEASVTGADQGERYYDSKGPIDGKKYKIIGDLTLYAHWAKQPSNLKINLNGGKWNMSLTSDEFNAFAGSAKSKDADLAQVYNGTSIFGRYYEGGALKDRFENKSDVKTNDGEVVFYPGSTIQYLKFKVNMTGNNTITLAMRSNSTATAIIEGTKGTKTVTVSESQDIDLSTIVDMNSKADQTITIRQSGSGDGESASTGYLIVGRVTLGKKNIESNVNPQTDYYETTKHGENVNLISSYTQSAYTKPSGVTTDETKEIALNPVQTRAASYTVTADPSIQKVYLFMKSCDKDSSGNAVDGKQITAYVWNTANSNKEIAVQVKEEGYYDITDVFVKSDGTYNFAKSNTVRVRTAEVYDDAVNESYLVVRDLKIKKKTWAVTVSKETVKNYTLTDEIRPSAAYIFLGYSLSDAEAANITTDPTLDKEAGISTGWPAGNTSTQKVLITRAKTSYSAVRSKTISYTGAGWYDISDLITANEDNKITVSDQNGVNGRVNVGKIRVHSWTDNEFPFTKNCSHLDITVNMQNRDMVKFQLDVLGGTRDVYILNPSTDDTDNAVKMYAVSNTENSANPYFDITPFVNMGVTQTVRLGYSKTIFGASVLVTDNSSKREAALNATLYFKNMIYRDVTYLTPSISTTTQKATNYFTGKAKTSLSTSSYSAPLKNISFTNTESTVQAYAFAPSKMQAVKVNFNMTDEDNALVQLKAVMASGKKAYAVISNGIVGNGAKSKIVSVARSASFTDVTEYLNTSGGAANAYVIVRQACIGSETVGEGTVIVGATRMTRKAKYADNVYYEGSSVATFLPPSDITVSSGEKALNPYAGQVTQRVEFNIPEMANCRNIYLFLRSTNGNSRVNIEGNKIENGGINANMTVTPPAGDGTYYNITDLVNEKGSAKIVVSPAENSGTGFSIVGAVKVTDQDAFITHFEQDSGTKINIPIPVRQGYTFVGWNRSMSYGTLKNEKDNTYTYTFGTYEEGKNSDEIVDTISAMWITGYFSTSYLSWNQSIADGYALYLSGPSYTTDSLKESAFKYDSTSNASKIVTDSKKGELVFNSFSSSSAQAMSFMVDNSDGVLEAKLWLRAGYVPGIDDTEKKPAKAVVSCKNGDGDYSTMIITPTQNGAYYDITEILNNSEECVVTVRPHEDCQGNLVIGEIKLSTPNKDNGKTDYENIVSTNLLNIISQENIDLAKELACCGFSKGQTEEPTTGNETTTKEQTTGKESTTKTEGTTGQESTTKTEGTTGQEPVTEKHTDNQTGATTTQPSGEDKKAGEVQIVNMKKYNRKTVDYKSTITFHCDVKNASGIVWYVETLSGGTMTDWEQQGNDLVVYNAKTSYKIYAMAKGNDGKLAKSETEIVNVKTSFFARLVAFFRGLFGKLPVLEQI